MASKKETITKVRRDRAELRKELRISENRAHKAGRRVVRLELALREIFNNSANASEYGRSVNNEWLLKKIFRLFSE